MKMKEYNTFFELIFSLLLMVFGVISVVIGVWKESILLIVVGFGLIITSHLGDIARKIEDLKK